MIHVAYVNSLKSLLQNNTSKHSYLQYVSMKHLIKKLTYKGKLLLFLKYEQSSRIRIYATGVKDVVKQRIHTDMHHRCVVRSYKIIMECFDKLSTANQTTGCESINRTFYWHFSIEICKIKMNERKITCDST